MVDESPFAIAASTESGSPALERILQKCARTGAVDSDSDGTPVLRVKHGWAAEFYRLDHSSVFRSLKEEAQTSVLRECSRKNIEEALMIEIAGMSYSAKMSLLSETLEQRELYSHFAADEANHFRMLRSLVGIPEPKIVDENPFLKLLGAMIQDESRASLVLLIQVILEGWGIPYYTRLATESLLPEVGESLQRIVADEAKHHGSGLLLFNENKLSPEELKRAKDRMTALLGMLRLGPASVVLALARELGEMNERDLARYLDETAFQEKLKSDLDLIQHLLKKSGAARTLDHLARNGLFETPSATECAARLSEIIRSAA